MIQYKCPKCGAAMNSPDSMAGQTETCPTCGNVSTVPQPTSVLAETSAPQAPTPAPRQRIAAQGRMLPPTKPIHIVLALIVLVGGVLSLFMMMDGCFGEPTPEEKAARDREWKRTEAHVMAQEFVERALRSPASARFGWQTADECVTELPNGYYAIKGWVDAQNAFGATIRHNYAVKLRLIKHPVPGKERWIVIEGPYIAPR